MKTMIGSWVQQSFIVKKPHEWMRRRERLIDRARPEDGHHATRTINLEIVARRVNAEIVAAQTRIVD